MTGDPSTGRSTLVGVVPPVLMVVSGAIGLVVWHAGLTGTWTASITPDVLDLRHALLATVSGFLACTPLLAGVVPVTTAALALVATASLVATGQATSQILAAPLLALALVAAVTLPRRLARSAAPSPVVHPGDIRRGRVALPRLPLGSVTDGLRHAAVLAAVALAGVVGGVAWVAYGVPQVRELRTDGVVVTTEVVDVTREGRRNVSRTAHLVMPDGTPVTLQHGFAWAGLELEVRWLPGTTRVEETSDPARPTQPLFLTGVGLAALVGAGAFVRRALVARRPTV